VIGLRTKAAVAVLAATLGAGAAAWAADGEAAHIERQHWTFSGMLGHFNAAQLQRGFRVYTEICSRCHSVKRLSFRNLVQPGGPAFPEAGVRSLAADNYKVDAEPNDQGKVLKRPAVLADRDPLRRVTPCEARAGASGRLASSGPSQPSRTSSSPAGVVGGR